MKVPTPIVDYVVKKMFPVEHGERRVLVEFFVPAGYSGESKVFFRNGDFCDDVRQEIRVAPRKGIVDNLKEHRRGSPA